MKLKSEWRSFGRHAETENGHNVWFHPSIPSQSEYVAEFMQSKGINLSRMRWRQHLFYILHGFLLDCVCLGGDKSIFGQYVADVDGKSLDEAYELHMSHPLLDERTYLDLQAAFEQTRDRSDDGEALDIDSDEDEELVEKKELA